MSSYRLTGKQLAFCKAIKLDGLNQIDSYEQAGYSMRQGRATAIANASRLMRNNNVVAWFDAFDADMLAKEVDQAIYDKKAAMAEANENMRMARELGQMGAANTASGQKQALEGLTVERRETKLVGGWDSVLDSVSQSARGLPTPDANAPVAPHQADDSEDTLH